MIVKNKVCCIADLLKAVREFDKSYSGIIYGAASKTSRFLYRGISNVEYKLIPSIFRTIYCYDRNLAESIGNEKYPKIYGSERDILKEFISYACSYIDEDPAQALYRWADYAQHYGVPTRFLDWTQNPLVALYFACRDHRPIYSEKDNHGGHDAVVWMIHMANYKKFAYNKEKQRHAHDADKKRTIGETITQLILGEKPVIYPILYKPYYKNLRMSAQSSYFMVWGSRKEAFESFFTSDNNLRSNLSNGTRVEYDNTKEIIFKFSVPAEKKQQLFNELNLCGINEKTLFPGLDGIGRYIEMKYAFDPNDDEYLFL